jgi:hypothetical protein
MLIDISSLVSIMIIRITTLSTITLNTMTNSIMTINIAIMTLTVTIKMGQYERHSAFNGAECFYADWYMCSINQHNNTPNNDTKHNDTHTLTDSIMTINIMTLAIITLTVTIKMRHSMNDTQHSVVLC